MSEDREQLRITILDFIADPMCEEDEAAWKRHLNTYDELLAEVKRLREELDETEYRLEMAEDVLGRSDWNTIYREIIDEDGGEE